MLIARKDHFHGFVHLNLDKWRLLLSRNLGGQPAEAIQLSSNHFVFRSEEDTKPPGHQRKYHNFF